ncbi:choloylglycine hydrolase [Aestuariivirga litoralis]|uniref:Choloylglycine hydrolase n=1 Tax=Aestuariivirga litoralis TaxID=2650924 RepID=A0A2W2CBK9_9HYPH|nr:choloylglycine hydrolase family protein [Aestuariivirga litoralis]PZF77573.1 choloylglycine hydrolase [Aestuariivirga litoralis]
MNFSFAPKLGRMALASALLLATTFTPSQACTGLKLVNKDGSFVTGRTVEFGIKIDATAALVPRGYAFTGKTPNGDGLKYTAKHAVVGVYAYKDVKIMDGMNDAGLVAGAFYLPTFASYTPVTAENQSRGLSSAEFPNWLLSQFGSVAEVRKAIEAGDAIITPTVLEGWGPAAPPFHYAVYDNTGAAIVIEPIDGKLVIHDNPLGTITNSPDFNWHMTNLRNYITLNPNNVDSGKIGNVELKAFGLGNGMWGLPGDFSPPSRFVRAALFSANALPSDNAAEGVTHVFHVLNNFDIPKGIGRSDVDGGVQADYTIITTAKDSQNLRYYYKTYDDQTIRMIDMKQLDLDAKDIQMFPIVSEQPIVDMSAKLK